MSRLIATGLLALALAGGVALPALPCLAHGRAASAVSVVYACGSLVCHQRPERSLVSCGRQWAVCGRCSGLYLGGACGVLLGLAGVARQGNERQWRLRIMLAAVPTALLWLGEALGLGDPGTPLRLAIAVPAGLMASLWLSAVARGDLR